MDYSRYTLLFAYGFLIATFVCEAAGDVDTSTMVKGLLSALKTQASTVNKARETDPGSSNLSDEEIRVLFNDNGDRLLPQTVPNSSSNGNGHVHPRQTGDFNARGTQTDSKASDVANDKVIEEKARGVSNATPPHHGSGKVNGVVESNVYFPDEKGTVDRSNPKVLPSGQVTKPSVVQSSDDKGVKFSKETTDTPGKIDIEPYFIINAPVRENDDSGGCKNGQTLVFGRCRDVLDTL